MKITLTQTDLNNALNIMQKAVASKNILPILSGILFKIDNGYLDLYSTDLEMSINCRLQINNADGVESVVVPAKLISDIVKNLPDSKIDLVIDGNNIKLYCGQSLFEIKTLPAEDFPGFPGQQAQKTILMSSKKLSEIVRQVIKASSKDETRPILCGILTIIENNKIKIVTTDSYRLAIREMESDVDVGEEIKVIIPARCMDEIAKITGDVDIEISPSKNQVYFKIGSVIIVSRLIEGNYPNYQQLLPDNYEVKVKLEKEKFISSIKRVALLSQSNGLIKIKTTKEKVQLSAGVADLGSAVEDVNAEVDGEDMEIAFNAQYVIDGLNSIMDDEVYLYLNNPIRPGILRPVKEQNFTYLIMPIRIG